MIHCLPVILFGYLLLVQDVVAELLIVQNLTTDLLKQLAGCFVADLAMHGDISLFFRMIKSSSALGLPCKHRIF